MKIDRQIMALGGIVLLGGSLFPVTESHAYGQQWRPDPAQIGLAGPSSQRAVGMPRFRPQAMPSAPRYQVPDRLPYRPIQPRGPWNGYMAGAPYGSPQSAYPGYGYAPQVQHFAGRMPVTAPAAVYPAGNMPPLFARQFAWRPAEQPWVVPVPQQGRQAYYPAPVAPPAIGFYPTGPFYGATAGAWPPGVYRPSYPVYPMPGPAPVYAVQQRPYFVPGGVAAWRSAGVPVAGASPVPTDPGRGDWRPVAAAGGDWRGAGVGFRPAAYGRSPQRDARLVSRTGEGFGFTRDKLPGWVTTYEDTADLGSCGWCDGS